MNFALYELFFLVPCEFIKTDFYCSRQNSINCYLEGMVVGGELQLVIVPIPLSISSKSSFSGKYDL